MENIRNDDNVLLTELEDKVLQVMDLFNRPVTAGEISEELNMPLKKVKYIFHLLKEKGKVVVYSSGQGKSQYYALASSKTGLDVVLSQKYADLAGSLEKQYADIKAENDALKQQVDKLYANIITLMGVFVAIFALIVVNVNAIGAYIETMSSTKELLFALVTLNIPLVVAIVILVLLIRFVLLPGLKKER